MSFLLVIIIIFGLMIFEIINSIDNAIVNATVLKTMSEKWRKWFLIGGIFTAIFLVRGVLPFLIIWLVVPEIGIIDSFKMIFQENPHLQELLEDKQGIILLGSGVFLLLLYLHWLFLEKKEPLFFIERIIQPHHGFWFFTSAALILLTLLIFASYSPFLMLSAAIGNALFFILYGFKEQAEKLEQNLLAKNNSFSDFSKLIYLEVLDVCFSIDSVVGAFAFTTMVPLIMIGGGIGALVVREITIKGINKIGKYKFLKNGAMTSIGFLGIFLILESFEVNLAEALPTVITVSVVGFAFWQSRIHLCQTAE